MNKNDKRIIADFIQQYASLELGADESEDLSNDDITNYNRLVLVHRRLCKELGIKYRCELHLEELR